MSILALVLAAILSGIAGFHALWAFGGTWPAASETELIRTVIGDPRLRRMPSRGGTLAVAGCIGAAAAVAALLRWPGMLPHAPLAAAGVTLATIFGGRGVAGYLPAWRRSHPAEPFARLDRTFYSPLCLVLGLGFAALAAARWSHS